MLNRTRWNKKKINKEEEEEKRTVELRNDLFLSIFQRADAMYCIQNVVLAALLRTCNLFARYERILWWNQQNAEQATTKTTTTKSLPQ